MRNISPILLWSLFFVGIIVLLGFVEKAHENQPCTKVVIEINQDRENYFIEEDDIQKMLPFDLKLQDSILITDIQAEIIEKKLNNHPAILNAEVYQSLDGNLNIYVEQRTPIARIYTQNKESFYLDELGYIMRLSNKFTSRVTVVSGYIKGNYDKLYLQNFNDKADTDSISDNKLMKDLFLLSNFIHKNDFWRAQIEHIYVNKELEVELIPRVGNHKIVLGEIVDIHQKFENLLLFYKEGLSKTGWNEYSIINLKFENQVVCTKRY